MPQVIRRPSGEDIRRANRHESSLSYFRQRLGAIMDAAGMFRETKQSPPGYPFLVLGEPALTIRGREMWFYRNALDTLRGPLFIIAVTMRLQRVQLEREAFLLLKDLAR